MTKRLVKLKNPNSPQIKAYERAVKKGLKSQHVIPVENGWAVKRAGSTRLTRVFDMQTKAVKYGKKIARHNKVELFVHKSNGRIKTRKSF